MSNPTTSSCLPFKSSPTTREEKINAAITEAAKRQDAIAYIRDFIWTSAKQHSKNYVSMAAAVEVLRFLEQDARENVIRPEGM